MYSGTCFRQFSFAKINLGLRILGKRNDGFHEIETVFQTINLKDEIEFCPVDNELKLTSDSSFCPSGQTNLVFKAATLLKKHTNTSKGCHIILKKKIPVGAGLGGGSSNAATTLVALNKIWNTGLTIKELKNLASQLGSDVPFFLYGGIALGNGRGEKLTQINSAPDYWGVLVCPNLQILSKWAYQQFNFNLTKSFKRSKFSVLTRNFPEFEIWNSLLVNDFENIVFNSYPELRTILNDLNQNGAFYARMSGSGSTLFGLFEKREMAQTAQNYFQKSFQTFVFQPVYHNMGVTKTDLE
ncbi:4-(cytidine 5'-diphospho)-2-C-methyl-D-erythritol kinase [candidate division KSB1 bacterium]|nr:4-(cytidine 5'-diphospho)-2-C-methyl-D-erythritol kinase [candidate division KSB1 bacterium]